MLVLTSLTPPVLTQTTCCYSHKTAEICQVIYKVEQLADVVGDGRAVGIHSFQMLLVHLTHACVEGREREE